MELQATDIIPMINYAWKFSFATVESNRKAISQRGWYPYNRNLLLHPELVVTMTEGEKCTAIQENLHPSKNKPFHSCSDITNMDASIPNFNPNFLTSSQNSASDISGLSQSLNYGSGIAFSCVESLIGHETLMQKKEEMKKKQTVGESLTECAKEGKRITAGLIFQSNTCRLGKTLLDIQEERMKKKKQDAYTKGSNAYDVYIKRLMKANDIIKKRPASIVGQRAI